MKEVTKEENDDSDAASSYNTEYSNSSESEVEHYLQEVALSPRQFTLLDARLALSYVQGKMKQQGIVFAKDNGCEVLSALHHHKHGSKTYSNFHRPERRIVRHTMELLDKNKENTFNIYMSDDVDFVEHPLSVSLIEKVPAPAIRVVLAKDDDRRHALRSTRVMFPMLPPLRPPPLQLQTAAASRKYDVPRSRSNPISFDDDDDFSNATYVKAELITSPDDGMDFENSDNCRGL